ncbi:hypothetical protein M441DRAFT_321198 [Trichoderma asperellum CBS 433.97]|uniref:Uncharacterized protein n=1 Tax=Trichoderma asperellum (strain ATCC 204424 / CBS 433.97 / NBRC 101777) TaxID=1042311 RepID=A0A2T3ZLD2_TRIA4|nr:hypothetical protein M441DRAFT_321198 [Trichoderma asperellum CBS 433.97]PTB45592.1 hypothetical protein M441DRAFT_321198 [Trichoderma asperellum CBS 433.97]
MLIVLRTYNDRPYSETRSQKADGPSLVTATPTGPLCLTTYTRIPSCVHALAGGEKRLLPKAISFFIMLAKKEREGKGKKKKKKKKAATLVVELVHDMIN